MPDGDVTGIGVRWALVRASARMRYADRDTRGGQVVDGIALHADGQLVTPVDNEQIGQSARDRAPWSVPPPRRGARRADRRARSKPAGPRSRSPPGPRWRGRAFVTATRRPAVACTAITVRAWPMPSCSSRASRTCSTSAASLASATANRSRVVAPEEDGSETGSEHAEPQTAPTGRRTTAATAISTTATRAGGAVRRRDGDADEHVVGAGQGTDGHHHGPGSHAEQEEPGQQTEHEVGRPPSRWSAGAELLCRDAAARRRRAAWCGRGDLQLAGARDQPQQRNQQQRSVATAAHGIGVISTSSWPRLKATSTAAMPIAAPSINHAVRVTTSSAISLPR